MLVRVSILLIGSTLLVRDILSFVDFIVLDLDQVEWIWGYFSRGSVLYFLSFVDFIIPDLDQVEWISGYFSRGSVSPLPYPCCGGLVGKIRAFLPFFSIQYCPGFLDAYEVLVNFVRDVSVGGILLISTEIQMLWFNLLAAIFFHTLKMRTPYVDFPVVSW